MKYPTILVRDLTRTESQGYTRVQMRMVLASTAPATQVTPDHEQTVSGASPNWLKRLGISGAPEELRTPDLMVRCRNHQEAGPGHAESAQCSQLKALDQPCADRACGVDLRRAERTGVCRYRRFRVALPGADLRIFCRSTDTGLATCTPAAAATAPDGTRAGCPSASGQARRRSSVQQPPRRAMASLAPRGRRCSAAAVSSGSAGP